jgi:DNA-binding response OmpR family regulator
MAKILIVDDEREICELTRDFLQRRKYTCFCATTPAEAMGWVEKENPDLVLLDVRLGEVSGLDVLARIKQLNRNIQVVMVSGLGDEETMRLAKAQGADDFITKPFTADFLNEFIIARLAQRKALKK